MTLAIFIFSGTVPVWKDKLNICVIGFTMELDAFNESKIDVITVSGCFAFTTVYNIYNFTFVNS